MDAGQLAVLRVLRRAKAEQDLTVRVLAERSGLARRTVSRLLCGRTWHWDTVVVIAAVLRVEITLTATTTRERARGSER